MAASRFYAVALMIALTGCRPEGALEVTQAGPSKLTFSIGKTDDEEARCIRSLSIYSLDDQLNYTEDDRVYERGSESGCAERLMVVLEPGTRCERRDGCQYRAVSRNGVYVYSADFRYDGTLVR
jgi:hypothetical protein